MHDNRHLILQQVLPLVPFEGWTEHTLAQAATQLKLSSVNVKQAFPRGIADCIDYFFSEEDRWLAETYPEASLASLRVPERIETLLLARLTHMLPHREAVRRAVAWYALPWNMAHALSSLYRSVDQMWRMAGDASLDFSFYTKRMTLESLYGSTLVFWLNDNSENYGDTHAFLRRRLENIADFGKWKKQLQSKATHFTGS